MRFPAAIVLLLSACGAPAAPSPRTPTPAADVEDAEAVDREHIERAARHALASPGEVSRAAMVVMDAGTGRTVLVGRGPYGDRDGLRPTRTGSTWKVLTVAAALEAGLAPDRRFPGLDGVFELEDVEVRDANPRPWLDARATIVHSSNVGAVQIVRAVGVVPLLRLLADLALARPIELPLGKAPGVEVDGVAAWSDLSDGSATVEALQWSAGIGSVATPLHLAYAMTAVARPDGAAVWPTAEGIAAPRPVLPPEVADRMRSYLVAAVDSGTGRRAATSGWTIGGKTGSTPVTGCVPEHTVGCERPWAGWFVGFALPPGQALPLVVAVRVVRGERTYGGAVAAPVVASFVRHLEDSRARWR